MSVAAIRKKCGLSQSAFAGEFGIPVRTLQQWEQGKSAPAPYVLSMLEDRVREFLLKKGRAAETQRHSVPEKHRWKVCIDEPFENCDRVYPIQQRKVRELLDDIVRDDAVTQVIVFGSSVTSRCHMGSDVDVFVQMDKKGNPARDLHDFEYDLWTNFTVDERLMREIREKGVVVYG